MNAKVEFNEKDGKVNVNYVCVCGEEISFTFTLDIEKIIEKAKKLLKEENEDSNTDSQPG